MGRNSVPKPAFDAYDSIPAQPFKNGRQKAKAESLGQRPNVVDAYRYVKRAVSVRNILAPSAAAGMLVMSALAGGLSVAEVPMVGHGSVNSPPSVSTDLHKVSFTTAAVSALPERQVPSYVPTPDTPVMEEASPLNAAEKVLRQASNAAAEMSEHVRESLEEAVKTREANQRRTRTIRLQQAGNTDQKNRLKRRPSPGPSLA